MQTEFSKGYNEVSQFTLDERERVILESINITLPEKDCKPSEQEWCMKWVGFLCHMANIAFFLIFTYDRSMKHYFKSRKNAKKPLNNYMLQLERN